jgi:tetratricopeptide (TPR) repeat protein
MDAIISEARGLADLGKYDEATSKLRLAHSQTADEAGRLHIVAEEATVLRQQGYWKDALHTIRRELENTPPQSKEYPIYLQLEMSALLLQPVVTGSFKGILDEAESAFGRFLELCRVGTIAEFDVAWVRSSAWDTPQMQSCSG